jgi:hypothetical protein
MFAKYIDENTIKLPPRKLVTPHLVAFNFNENVELMKQEGYLPVIEDEKPEEMAQGYHLEPRYSVVEAHHTETVEKPTVLVNEDGTEENTTVTETVIVDDSSIRVSWVEVEDVEEAEE